MNKVKNVLMILILLSLIGLASASTTAEKSGGSGGGGLPNNPYIDAIKNSLAGLSVAITCPGGYVYCYEQNNIYGDAQAMARVYLSDPYIEGNNLYINYKGDATKYYVYRGLTAWSQVNCDPNGCYGAELVGSNGKYLLGSSPSTSQQGFVFVAWDYNSYNGYWSWTWAGYGWLQPFNYNLQTPTATPTPTPACCTGTPTPTSTPNIPTPPSNQPSISVVQILSQIWTWISGIFGLSISGSSDVVLNSGSQTFAIQSTASEAPHTAYTDGTYSELWGTWMVVDKNQNIIAQKGGWQKLTGNTYTDSAIVNFANAGTYSVVSVVVKVPYTYSSGQWTKGTETIVGQDKLGVTVKLPAPTGGAPTTSLMSILASLLTWIRGVVGI